MLLLTNKRDLKTFSPCFAAGGLGSYFRIRHTDGCQLDAGTLHKSTGACCLCRAGGVCTTIQIYTHIKDYMIYDRYWLQPSLTHTR